MTKDEFYMGKALAEAKTAYAVGEIPIGAVIVYDVTDPNNPAFYRIDAVGENDVTGCSEEGSKVYPEGISSTQGAVWTANEGDDSITYIHY